MIPHPKELIEFEQDQSTKETACLSKASQEGMMKNLNHTRSLKEGINQIESQSLPNLYKLVTWSRKKQERLIMPSVMNVFLGQKRTSVAEENPSELPIKKQMVSNSREEKSEMVEAGSQPCQTQ